MLFILLWPMWELNPGASNDHVTTTSTSTANNIALDNNNDDQRQQITTEYDGR